MRGRMPSSPSASCISQLVRRPQRTGAQKLYGTNSASVPRDTLRDTDQWRPSTFTTSLMCFADEKMQVEAGDAATGFLHNPSGRGFEPHPPHRWREDASTARLACAQGSGPRTSVTMRALDSRGGVTRRMARVREHQRLRRSTARRGTDASGTFRAAGRARPGVVGEEVFVVVVAVVEQCDDDHALAGPSRRMSSERSARSCSAERVPALANRRGAVGTGPSRLARRICSSAGSRVSGIASSNRCTSSRLVMR